MTDGSECPKLSKAAVCVTDDPILAAIISSYFNSAGEYFVVFQQHRLKERPTDLTGNISVSFYNAHIVNRIQALRPAKIIYAGLNDFQKSAFQFSEELVINISGVDDVYQVMDAEFSRPTLELRCTSDSVHKGLALAKEAKAVLLVDDTSQELMETGFLAGRGTFVIEDDCDIPAIATVNLATASSNNIRFVPKTGKKEVYALKTLIESAGNRIEGHDLATAKERIAKVLSGVRDDLLSSTWITFLTLGVPYSLITEHALPVALLYRTAAPMRIFDCLHKEQFSDYFYSAFFFSVPNDEVNNPDDEIRDETLSIASLLTKNKYVVVLRANQQATRLNFDNYVSSFPYDILHIGSHGGGCEGLYHRVILTDASSHDHVFDYYEIKSFDVTDQIGADGKPMIGVTTMMVPITYDGHVWGSEEALGVSDDAHDAVRMYLEDGSVIPKQKTSIPMNGRVPHSRLIKCIDNVHMGSFHYLACQTVPFIFNNSCSSWFDFGIYWISIGASPYVGTLWNVDNTIAKNCAEHFYNLAVDQEIDLMTACNEMNKLITNDRYRDIYVYWGLPWAFIRKPHQPRSMIFYKLVQHLKATLELHEKPSDHPRANHELRERLTRFMRQQIKVLTDLCWPSK